MISSPYRKLPCVDGILSPLNVLDSSYRQFLEMLPEEVIHLHEKPLDYICGVSRGSGICKESIYCRFHLFGERALVERSKSLSELMLEEMKLVAWFQRFHELAGSLHTCKAYFMEENLRSFRTCSRSSCEWANEPQTNTNSDDGKFPVVMENPLKLATSPKPLLLVPSDNTNAKHHKGEFSSEDIRSRNLIPIFPGQNTHDEPDPHSRKKFKLIKALFMSKLSRSADAEMEDIVSYLHYKLGCYQDVELDVRAREMQVQYDSYWRSDKSPQ